MPHHVAERALGTVAASTIGAVAHLMMARRRPRSRVARDLRMKGGKRVCQSRSCGRGSLWGRDYDEGRILAGAKMVRHWQCASVIIGGHGRVLGYHRSEREVRGKLIWRKRARRSDSLRGGELSFGGIGGTPVGRLRQERRGGGGGEGCARFGRSRKGGTGDKIGGGDE
jgi:hypothetical protein